MKLRYFGVILCSALMAGCADTSEIIPDFCPGNPNKDAPGICGCDKPDTDENQNGIIDCLETGTDGTPGIDLCPDNDNKTLPGICGCEKDDTDTDGDKTPDCFDKCENNPNKLYPGYCGCDSDADDVDENANTIPDCIENEGGDLCPDDPDKTAPGICDCGTPDKDTDGDGTMDCIDMCPEDPGKTEKGICDCGNPDTDSDGDTVPDCQDECAQDNQKTEKGICGCNVEDSEEKVADSDGDTVPDCLDGCPENPNKTEPGEAGCDAAEAADADGDGVDNENDPCPYNPNITEGKDVDCNYVTQNDELIFEIWHATDLERLRTEIKALLSGDQDGLACSAGNSSCSDDASAIIACKQLDSFVLSDVGTSATTKCSSNQICQVNSAGKAECVALACNDAKNPSKPNDCCTSDFSSICNSEKEIYKCLGDRIVASACTKCTTSNGIASCKTCNETDNPSKFNDCCDSSFQTKCSTGNEQLACVNDSVVASPCPGGCTENSDTKEIVCLGCKNSDDTPSKVGDCCVAGKDFVDICQSDKKSALKCLNGYIQEVSCAGGCSSTDSAIFCQKEPEGLLHVRLMNDIDLGDTGIQKKTVHSICYGEWTPLELYRTHFDGNDKQISFAECTLVRPLFNTILESKVSDLKLNYDLGGNISSALGHLVSDSHIDKVSYNGVVKRAATIFDEVTTGFGTFAAFANNSTFSNLSYSGSFDSPAGNTFGFVNKAQNSNFLKLEAKPELFRCYSNACSPGFNLFYNTNMINEITIDAPKVEQVSGSLFGFANSANNTTYIQDSSVKLGDISYSNSSFYAFAGSLYKTNNISLELDNAAGTGQFYIASTVYNKNADWKVKLKSLTAGTAYLLSSNTSGSAIMQNWAIDIDEINSTGSVYILFQSMNTNASLDNFQYHIKKLSASNSIYLMDSLYNNTSITHTGIRLDYAKANSFAGIRNIPSKVETTLSDFSMYVDGYLTSSKNTTNANFIQNTGTADSVSLQNIALSGHYHACQSANDCSAVTPVEIPMVFKTLNSDIKLNAQNVYWHKYTDTVSPLPQKFSDVETMSTENTEKLEKLNAMLTGFTPSETSTIVSALAKESANWTSLEVTGGNGKIQIPWYGK